MMDVEPVIAKLPNHSAFDAVAAAYDSDFSRHPLGQWLREAVHRNLADWVNPGDHVLELGCGTGEDALWLARRGATVTATDASIAMLEVAAAKTTAAGVIEGMSFAQLDLLQVGGGEGADQGILNANLALPSFHYDKVLANFGVLNCLPDRRALAATLAQWVRPGGHVALILMSPICPWEIIWHVAHGQIRSAFRRLRSGDKAHLGEGATVRVWYPSPRRLCAEFAPHFRPVHAAGIGVLLPPSYLRQIVTRWPRFFARLARWERHLEQHFPWTWATDHYLIVLERQPVTHKL